MKKKEPANNIILNDKEMEVFIRQLVNMANEKGVCMSTLNKAVTAIWREEIRVEEKQKTQLTAKEKEFSVKVKKFLRYYENALTDFHDNQEKRKGRATAECAENKKILFEKYYKTICSIYGVFESEDKITQSKIIKFAIEHFDFNYSRISDVIDLLYYFIYSHITFDNTSEFPEYSRDWGSNRKPIYFVEDFNNFKKQYDISRHRIYETSTAVIWLIEKYF